MASPATLGAVHIIGAGLAGLSCAVALVRRGANVMTTLTAPHSFTAARLASLRAELNAEIAALPRPRVAVVLGGKNGVYRFKESDDERFRVALASIGALGASFMITPSRRSHQRLVRAADAATADRPRILWDMTGPNPYPHFLAHADARERLCDLEGAHHAGGADPVRRKSGDVVAGQRDPAEIIASVKNGVFAANFGGGQVDITSGKYVFQCTEAYKIENGKVGAPLKGAMLIGNGPTDLHRITMIGNDLSLDTGIGTCGKNGQGVPVGVGQPTLRMDRITVGGTGR